MGTIDRENAESAVRKPGQGGMARMFEDAKRFLKEVRIEMTKVTWPGKLELRGSTVLVILVSLFFAFYIFVIDFIITNFVKLF